VFFLSPLDMEILEGFGVLDRKQYNANSAAIRAVVERHGLTFVDWNQPKLTLPSSAFADMTHTTDAGSALFAKRLYKKLAPLLRSGVGGGGAAAAPAASPTGSRP
jgi:lysophospholipase L1-like esterase